MWPVVSDLPPYVAEVGSNDPRSFSYLYDGGASAGVVLPARLGELVIAPEDGRVVFSWPWPSPIAPIASWLMFATTRGPVLALGPIANESWTEFAVPTVAIPEGHPIGRVGIRLDGLQGLTLQLLTKGSTRPATWDRYTQPPSNLIDPTDYARSLATRLPEQQTAPSSGSLLLAAAILGVIYYANR